MIKSTKDLWIGDLLQLKNSGRIGKFTGTKPDGKLIVQTDDNIIITPLSNVTQYTPPQDPDLGLDFDLDYKSKAIDNISELKNLSQIDLHISILAPHMENQPAARILDFQMKSFNDFVNDAYARKRNTVKIIHGKGEGVLKTEVQYHLKRDNRVSMISEINKGGATDVWFNY